MVSLNIVFGVNQVIVALLYLILYEINQVMFSEEQYDLKVGLERKKVEFLMT